MRIIDKSKNRRINGYLFALLISGATFILKVQLIHIANWPEKGFLLANLAIIAAGWYGGFGPGAVATLTSYLFYDYFFVTPGYIFVNNPVGVNIRILIFVVEGFLVSWTFESLHRARRKAESLDKNKTEFLSVVAHELRTPIATIKIISESFFKVLRKEKRLKDTPYIRDILEEVSRVEIMVRDLIDISKFENNIFALRKELTDINTLIASVIGKMKSLSGNENIVFEKQKTGKIFIDKDRIEQVLINLITNALDNSGRRSPIQISSKKADGSVIISVSDKGKGIPRDKLKKVFDKYYQVPDNRSKGFGLGLFISKQIVEKHGGKIWVDSDVGRGSTFYFSLPTK